MHNMQITLGCVYYTPLLLRFDYYSSVTTKTLADILKVLALSWAPFEGLLGCDTRYPFEC